jgi:biotin carboxylase
VSIAKSTPKASDKPTVLFVGASITQRDAILRAQVLGFRVVAVDRNPRAAGLALADVADTLGFRELEEIVALARRQEIDGVLTVGSDRAVPVVAAVAEALGLPGIGSETAHVMRNKGAMRGRLSEHGIPQPHYMLLDADTDTEEAAGRVGFPAVLKPTDSSGQRGVSLVNSARDVQEALPSTLSFSASGEAILESYCPGLELNAVLVVRDGEPFVLTLSDRLRPAGQGFAVGWAHVFPTTIGPVERAEAERVAAAAVRACGLRDGIAFPQLIVGEGGDVRVIEVGARIPAGQMADLVRHGTGVDLVEIVLLQALGEPIPDEVALPRFEQPLGIAFFTADPGLLRTGVVRSVGSLARVREQPGVVQADSYIEVGETILPVQLDIDRRGYVIATGATGDEGLKRAREAAKLFQVEVETAAR